LGKTGGKWASTVPFMRQNSTPENGAFLERQAG
jgi:hypothetical protein